ncbi:hypothetical protein HDU82_008387, partial [Entophlyctis luteolus]
MSPHLHALLAALLFCACSCASLVSTILAEQSLPANATAALPTPTIPPNVQTTVSTATTSSATPISSSMILTGNGTGFIYQTQLILPYESYNATVVYSFTIDQFPRLNVHYDKLVSNQNETFIDLIVEIGLLSVVEFNDTQNASFSSSSISLANQTSWSPVELTSAVDCSEGENITQQIAKTIFTDGNFTLHLNALASQPIPGVQILKFQILYGGYPYSLNDSQLGFQVAESASGSVSGPDIDGVASESG